MISVNGVPRRTQAYRLSHSYDSKPVVISGLFLNPARFRINVDSEDYHGSVQFLSLSAITLKFGNYGERDAGLAAGFL